MKILLIPSAVLVPKEMRKNFGELPTALFPLADVPMIEHIYKKYKNVVDKIYITVYKKKELIEQYIISKKLPIEIIVLDKVEDLGYTVSYSIDNIIKKNDNIECIYINFADSLLDDNLKMTEQDAIYYNTLEVIDEWTYFKDKSGQLLDILDIEEIKESNDNNRIASFSNIFVGVFCIKDIIFFQKCIKEKLIKKLRGIDSFYDALYLYSQDNPMLFIKVIEWFDVGHSENYFKAKTKVAARAFNTISIDEKRGILTKFSQNKEKLINEIRWYLKMPNKLQYLVPRIYDYSLDRDSPYVSMEYYGYHTLHETLLYGDVSLIKWRDIFEKLLFIIEDMEKFKVVDSDEIFKDAIYKIYVKKTIDRLNKINKSKDFSNFFKDEIIINGKKYKSLTEYLKILPELVENRLTNYTYNKFNIIHGDLCFTNILMEDSYKFMRLIDPRGQFGAFDIYGDQRYELAKLLHTLEGNYDCIIEDMFDITIEGNCIKYNSHKNTQDICKVFFDVFKNKLENVEDIRLIEATLFLSMIPLHSDAPLRQYAMLATGVILLDSVINSNFVSIV